MNFKDVNPLLIRRPSPSWYEKDPEVFEFINNLNRYCTIEEIRRLITERFGPARTPSKSNLARFAREVAKAHTQDRGASHGK